MYTCLQLRERGTAVLKPVDTETGQGKTCLRVVKRCFLLLPKDIAEITTKAVGIIGRNLSIADAMKFTMGATHSSQQWGTGPFFSFLGRLLQG